MVAKSYEHPNRTWAIWIFFYVGGGDKAMSTVLEGVITSKVASMMVLQRSLMSG